MNSPRGHTTSYTLGPVGIVGVVFKNSLTPNWQIYSTPGKEPSLDSCHDVTGCWVCGCVCGGVSEWVCMYLSSQWFMLGLFNPFATD